MDRRRKAEHRARGGQPGIFTAQRGVATAHERSFAGGGTGTTRNFDDGGSGTQRDAERIASGAGNAAGNRSGRRRTYLVSARRFAVVLGRPDAHGNGAGSRGDAASGSRSGEGGGKTGGAG